MKDYAKRIAIAELDGWLFEDGPSFCGWIKHGHPVFDHTELPDYLNDLNAAHEALKVLHRDEILWKKYRDYMHRFHIANDTFPPSAAQICEGILNAIDKWTPDNLGSIAVPGAINVGTRGEAPGSMIDG